MIPTSSRRAQVLPLVLATMTSQALLVVLAPTMPAIAAELRASVPTVGQARTVTAVVAVAASLVVTARIGAIGVPRLLRAGCVLTAGFAGVVAFDQADRPWAIGHVAGANGLAWIVVNPIAGALTEWLAWRTAHAIPALLALATLAVARATADVPQAPARCHCAHWSATATPAAG